MAVRFHDLFLTQWWLFSYLYNRNDKTISMRITFLVTSHWLPVAFYLLPSWVPHCATQWRGAETLQQKQAGQQRDRGELSKGGCMGIYTKICEHSRLWSFDTLNVFTVSFEHFCAFWMPCWINMDLLCSLSRGCASRATTKWQVTCRRLLVTYKPAPKLPEIGTI